MFIILELFRRSIVVVIDKCIQELHNICIMNNVLLTIKTRLEPTPYLKRLIKEAEGDYKSGKNISKRYNTVDDFFKDLDKGV